MTKLIPLNFLANDGKLYNDNQEFEGSTVPDEPRNTRNNETNSKRLTSQDGRYELISLIGSGGMSEIYRARDHKEENDVAVKLFPKSLLDRKDLVLWFRNEYEAMRRIKTPHVPEVGRFFCIANNQFGFSMELADKDVLDYVHETPARHIYSERRRKRLDERVDGTPVNIDENVGVYVPELSFTRNVMVQIALALQASESEGIVHYDVKPSNFLLYPKGNVKLTDFGIAKLLLGGFQGWILRHFTGLRRFELKEGTTFGTPGFMSPEQAYGHSRDARSDYFSFGTSLYLLTTGVNPFNGKGKVESIHRAVQALPPPPSSISPLEIPKELDALIMELLEKNPHKRPTSMSDVAMRLQKMDLPYEEDE
jgi:eukaryotic-like serine/threonine-protein kinase